MRKSAKSLFSITWQNHEKLRNNTSCGIRHTVCRIPAEYRVTAHRYDETINWVSILKTVMDNIFNRA